MSLLKSMRGENEDPEADKGLTDKKSTRDSSSDRREPGGEAALATANAARYAAEELVHGRPGKAVTENNTAGG